MLPNCATSYIMISRKLVVNFLKNHFSIIILFKFYKQHYFETLFNLWVPDNLWLSAIVNNMKRASLVAQWLRICLLMQGARVRALVWEDPTCCGAARLVSHNYWACASGACAPQQERLRQWEARAPRWRVAPACHN